MLKLDGVKLKNARLDKGLTKEEAARMAGVSEPTYARAEDGQLIHGSTARCVCDSLSLILAEVRISDETVDEERTA